MKQVFFVGKPHCHTHGAVVVRLWIDHMECFWGFLKVVTNVNIYGVCNIHAHNVRISVYMIIDTYMGKTRITRICQISVSWINNWCTPAIHWWIGLVGPFVVDSGWLPTRSQPLIQRLVKTWSVKLAATSISTSAASKVQRCTWDTVQCQGPLEEIQPFLGGNAHFQCRKIHSNCTYLSYILHKIVPLKYKHLDQLDMKNRWIYIFSHRLTQCLEPLEPSTPHRNINTMSQQSWFVSVAKLTGQVAIYKQPNLSRGSSTKEGKTWLLLPLYETWPSSCQLKTKMDPESMALLESKKNNFIALGSIFWIPFLASMIQVPAVSFWVPLFFRFCRCKK